MFARRNILLHKTNKKRKIVKAGGHTGLFLLVLHERYTFDGVKRVLQKVRAQKPGHHNVLRRDVSTSHVCTSTRETQFGRFCMLARISALNDDTTVSRMAGGSFLRQELGVGGTSESLVGLSTGLWRPDQKLHSAAGITGVKLHSFLEAPSVCHFRWDPVVRRIYTFTLWSLRRRERQG